MKKYSIILLTAVLLGILMPVFEFYLPQEKAHTITMSEESRKRNAEHLMELASDAFYEGNYQSAENYYQEVIETAPFNLEARRNLAVVYNETKQLEAENDVLLKTAILSGDSRDLLELALSFYKINNSRAALFLLENKVDAEQLTEENNLYRKYYYAVEAALDLEEFAVADKYLSRLAEFNLNQSQTYLLQAERSRLEGDYEQAFNYLQKSYQENRSQTFLFKEMAFLLEKSGEEIQAYNYWQRSLAYGLFEDTAYQKINYFQDKYPSLRADESEEEPEEIDPFRLSADWKEIKDLDLDGEAMLLRIGLQEDNKHILFQYSHPFSIIYQGKIIFKGNGRENYLLEIESDKLVIRSAQREIVLGSLNNEYQIYSSLADSSFYIYNIGFGEGYFWQSRGNRQYRGNMIIKAEEESFTLINEVDLTEYLLSVVPSEIYSSWPKESLKAQTIAARSYTLSNLGRHSSDGYDLCDSVHCAAYNGVGQESPSTTEAVLETYKEAAFYDNDVIEAVFSSNSGGFTERSDQIWSADLYYLRGSNQMKDQSYSFPLSPLELKRWVINSPESYSKDYGSSSYRWQLKIPAEVIEDKSGIKNLKSIEIVERATGGTVTSLKIIGEEEEKTYHGAGIRRLMGGLKSSRFYLESSTTESDYIDEIYIYGAGWGHNLGMDQSAAAGMAAAGWDYQEIIKHFYPGVEIRKFEKDNF